MTLQLGIRLTLDKGNVTSGVAEAAGAIGGIGTAAKGAGAEARTLQTALADVGRATTATDAQAQAITAIGAAAVAATARVDAMGMTIARSPATVTAALAVQGQALDQIRARWDPLFAATKKYEAALAEVNEAHRVGAIGGADLVARQVEMKAAYDRTTSAMRQQGQIAKEAAQTFVARQTVVPNRAADIAAYGEEMDRRQAAFDQLFAAQQKYSASLAAVRAAHASGAIDVRVLRDREAEYRDELDRTTTALVRNSGEMRRHLVGRNSAPDMSADILVARQTVVPDRAADIAAYGEEMDRRRAAILPLAAAEQAHAKKLAEIAESESVGAITSEQATAAVARATAMHRIHVMTLEAEEKSLLAHAGGMKLNGLAAQQLSYQMNDVVVSLMSGMNPLMVLVQQGSQITPIFGGIAGTFRAVATAITPALAGYAALTAAVALAGKATWDHQEATRASAVAANGLGRNLGTSAGEIERIARGSADAGGVSISSAREMAQEFTRTGKIGVENFSGLIGITKDFAATIGTDVPAATQKLAEIMADPAKGAVTLSQSLGLVDGATARVVQRLSDQNRIFEAQATLVAALKGRLIDAAEAQNVFGRGADKVGIWWSNRSEAIGRAMASDVVGAGDDVEAARTKVAKLEALAQRATTGSAVKADAEEALTLERRKLEVLERQEASRQRWLQMSIADRAISRGVAIAEASPAPEVQESLRRRRLTDEIELLKAARSAAAERWGAETRETPGLAQRAEESIGNTDTAIETKMRAQRTFISEQQRAQQLAEVDLALAAARDPVERAALERKRVLIGLAGQEIRDTTALAAANLAYGQSLGLAVAQTRGRIADLGDEAAARQRVNDLVMSGGLAAADADRELQVEAETRHLVAAAARAEGAEKQQLLDLAAGLADATRRLADEQKRASALQSLVGGAERLDTLRTEIALVGQSEAARTRALGLLEAEQRILRDGLGGTAIADRIRDQAAATAELTTALERRRRALDLDRGYVMDRVDLRLTATRDPVERASLEATRASTQALSQGKSEAEAAADAARAYARALGEVEAQARGFLADLAADAAARTRVNGLVAAGAISLADVNRELQIEAATRQLVARAAQAEGAEKARLNGIIAETRAAITAQDQAQRLASAQQSLVGGAERIETLRTEIALVGQSEAVRTRSLALLEAEQRIRREGLGGTAIADQIRAQATATAELTTALERQKAAWGEIQTAGGSVIDTLVEGMRTGKDVSAQVLDDLSKEAAKLAIANPLKNAMFGQNLPTFQDAGGLLGGLFGGGAKTAAGLAGGGAIGTATITAATVIIQGGVGSLLGGGAVGGAGAAGGAPLDLTRAANDNALRDIYTGRRGGIEGLDTDFAGRLKAFTAANPGVTISSGFRSVERQRELWDEALAKYGSPEEARRWVAPPGRSMHNHGLAADLAYESPEAAARAHATAGQYGLRFPLSNENWHVEPAGARTAAGAPAMDLLSASANRAGQSITGLGSGAGEAARMITTAGGGIGQAGQTLTTSTTNLASGTQGAFSQLLGGLGSGIDGLLSGLGNIVSKIAGSGGTGLFGGLFAGLFGGTAAPVTSTPTMGGLYAVGGYTGAGHRLEPAGIVHRGEYVFDAEATRSIGVGNLEAMRQSSRRGYASGGWVGASSAMAASAASGATSPSAPTLHQTIINNTPAEVSTREEQDGRGGRRQVVVIEEAVGQALSRPGSAARSAVGRTFGVRTGVVRR